VNIAAPVSGAVSFTATILSYFIFILCMVAAWYAGKFVKP
jgi:hypothetical protein